MRARVAGACHTALAAVTVMYVPIEIKAVIFRAMWE